MELIALAIVIILGLAYGYYIWDEYQREKKKEGVKKIMLIEIEENDFKEIEDKVGGIRAAAVQARMTTDQERDEHLRNIVGWANEITLFLHDGVVADGSNAWLRKQNLPGPGPEG